MLKKVTGCFWFAMLMASCGLSPIQNDAPCPAGQVSSAGACTTLCSADTDCGEGHRCGAGMCVEAGANLSFSGLSPQGENALRLQGESLQLATAFELRALGRESILLEAILHSNQEATLTLPGKTRFSEEYALVAVNEAGNSLATTSITFNLEQGIVEAVEEDPRFQRLLGTLDPNTRAIKVDRATQADTLQGKTYDDIHAEIQAAVAPERVVANLQNTQVPSAANAEFAERAAALENDRVELNNLIMGYDGGSEYGFTQFESVRSRAQNQNDSYGGIMHNYQSTSYGPKGCTGSDCESMSLYSYGLPLVLKAPQVHVRGELKADNVGRVTVKMKGGQNSSTPIQRETIVDLCGDEDGCNLRMGSYNWNGQRRTASRSTTFYYDGQTNNFRSEYGNREGKTGDGHEHVPFDAWECSFTDAKWVHGGRLDDNTNMHLRNRHSSGAHECRLTIID